MTALEKLQDYLNVTITDNYRNDVDLTITYYTTADGYQVYYMGEDSSDIDWENDMYYNAPYFVEIMDRIIKLREDNKSLIIYVVDIDDVYATVYFSKYGFVSRYKYGDAKVELYVKNLYTFHLFNDEHNLKQKVRISVA